MQIRHGDILLIRVDNAEPSKRTREKSLVLAYGEATGHSHVLTGKVKKTSSGIQVRDNATLAHEEHGIVEIPSGSWTVRQQTEWVQEQRQTVRD